MTATQIALGKLFNPDSGRAFVTAFDHGTTVKLGPTAPPMEVLEKIVAGGPDGVLVSPGMLRAGSRFFARRGAPVPVLRTDWTVVNEDWKQESGEHYRVLMSPSDAQGLGAGAICMYLVMGPAEGTQFADNVEQLAKAAVEAHRVGMPLIVEVTLWGSRYTDKKDVNALAHGCRMAYEFGADVIKTEYTGDAASMRSIVDSVAVPVLTLGGARGDKDAVIAAARGAIAGGASGLVFGRNVWQADDPVVMAAELRAIVHEEN